MDFLLLPTHSRPVATFTPGIVLATTFGELPPQQLWPLGEEKARRTRRAKAASAKARGRGRGRGRARGRGGDASAPVVPEVADAAVDVPIGVGGAPAVYSGESDAGSEGEDEVDAEDEEMHKLIASVGGGEDDATVACPEAETHEAMSEDSDVDGTKLLLEAVAIDDCKAIHKPCKLSVPSPLTSSSSSTDPMSDLSVVPHVFESTVIPIVRLGNIMGAL